MPHVLYPSSPLRSRQPDEQYAGEVEAVRASGFEVSLFSFEDFQSGSFRASPTLPQSAEVLYRGWMLNGSEYEALATATSNSGAKLFTPLKTYLSSHHLPNWYPLIADLTPETRVFPPECDLESELRGLNWPEYFIKDYVKSLKTSVGSRITSPNQVATVVSEMQRFRGQIEGGFCVRRVESFVPDSERRYFVLNGVPRAQAGEIPAIVHDCTKRIPSRFFSVDVVTRSDGVLRIVEVGDGQVSDLVGWTPEMFADVLAKSFLAKLS